MVFKSFEDLQKIDEQREKDGFQKKIKARRMIVGPGRIIVVPVIEEEKFIHGEFEPASKSGQSDSGSGEGAVGDIVGRQRILEEGEDSQGDDGDGAGRGEGEHSRGIETKAREIGAELSERLKLPNLKDKNKKVVTDDYTYELTDRNKGSGQVVDVKNTLVEIVKSNLILGRVNKNNVDPKELMVFPGDIVYSIFSRERVWKSKAVVFFVRDYSYSMIGEPTEAIVNQHVMLYSWLWYQYEGLVIPIFIVHDIEAKEVSPDSYFSEYAQGGTRITSAYKKINEIVESEGYAKDYNIYVFQGTDGEDWGEVETINKEIERILSYVNRMGVTTLRHKADEVTELEKYIEVGNFLERKDLFRMYIMPSRGVTDEQNEKAITELLSED